ncbi:hypothetical protein LguiA_009255 [Lonicera macranthoides]
MNNFIVNLKKKLFPSLFFLISSWVIIVNGAGGGAESALPCIQKLLPCQPYLLAPTNPPATCCLPLREIITNEKECICSVFKNPEIMKSLNVTLEQALKLPKACAINNADASLCNNNATAPTGSPATPSAPAPPKGSNAANGMISSFGGSFVVAVSCMVLFISLFH